MNKIFYLLIFLFLHFFLFSTTVFHTYKNDFHKNNHKTINDLLQKKENFSKGNENYFHEAQFAKQGITIFTFVTFNNSVFGENDCKLNCIITFKNGETYVFDQDYSSKEVKIHDGNFHIQFGKKNYLRINKDVYAIKIDNKDIHLSLNYHYSNNGFIFGDGKVQLSKKKFLGFSQPIIGAQVQGKLKYQEQNISLDGWGSVDHDFNNVSPIDNPRLWRSFWFYEKKYAIIIHTFILPDGRQIDRMVFCKDGQIVSHYINQGLNTKKKFIDQESQIDFPAEYAINYQNDSEHVKAEIKYLEFTNKVQAFAHLPPLVHKIVAMAVGEMWGLRFWARGKFTIQINGRTEEFQLTGLGNYVDVVK
ncbi:MAG: hypothetical protein MJB14_21800 [Spirochaetes bacterium]|nr:hypothetical protein [Spirochaetota bacterium]